MLLADETGSQRVNHHVLQEFAYATKKCSLEKACNSIGLAEYMSLPYVVYAISIVHWRSQNAEKVTHIKERLLDQALILFNCVPFQNGNFS